MESLEWLRHEISWALADLVVLVFGFAVVLFGFAAVLLRVVPAELDAISGYNCLQDSKRFPMFYNHWGMEGKILNTAKQKNILIAA